MQDIVGVARRFFETRRELLSLSADPCGSQSARDIERIRELRARMETLAWVLGVDLELMDMPKPTSPLGPLTRVQVHPVPDFGGYVVQFPAEETDGWQTEEWGAFVSLRQMRQLCEALLRGDAHGEMPPVQQPVSVPMRRAPNVRRLSWGQWASWEPDADVVDADLPSGA